jgi:hypothetical protein
VPFCQLPNLKAPLEMSIESDRLVEVLADHLVGGQKLGAQDELPVVERPMGRNVTVLLALHLDLRDVLPTLARDDVPVRVQDRLYVARKSAPVTLPSPTSPSA